MKCGKKAKSRVTWVTGQQLAMCEEHETIVRNLCSHMGWPLTIVPLGETKETCESETKE